MRSSTPSTNPNLDPSAMYGHTFITDGHDGVICAYNVQGVDRSFIALTTVLMTQYCHKIAFTTSIMYHRVKFVVRSEVKTDD